MLIKDDFFSNIISNINPYLLWTGLVVAFLLLLWGLASLVKRMKSSPTKGRKLTLKERLSRRLVQ
ncbi:MAG TPA: hypothetical protein VN249_07220, partial [Prolixibacteraceae bacterium]|nr:hypothetical protein [Prolixibacteraceae bacterium]